MKSRVAFKWQLNGGETLNSFFDPGYLNLVEYTVNNVDLDYWHKDGHEDHVDDGHTDGHADALTWSYVVSIVTIRKRNVHICTYLTAYIKYTKIISHKLIIFYVS